ncbi:tetratricopeptide repeat protein [Algibacter mikhailovii]|nr:tetratricopeptide repeat protein [Algibacter mikhailovii]
MTKMFFVIIAICSSILYGQQSEEQDSLDLVFRNQKHLNNKIETARIIYQKYKNTEAQFVFNISNEVLELSKKENYPIGEGIASRFIAYYYRFKPNIDSSRFYFNQSFKTLENSNAIKDFCETTEEYATFECVQGNYDKALNIAEQGFRQASKIKSSEQMVMCLNRKATINMDSGNFTGATKSNLLALKILDTTTLQLAKLKAISLGHKARIEMLRGNYELTLQPLQEALNLLITLNDKQWMTVNYIEMGNAHWYLNNFNEALINYNKGLTLSKELKRHDITSICYSNIASINIEQGHYKEAIEVIKKSIEADKAIGSMINLTIAYNMLGDAYYNTNNIKQATKSYTNAIILADSIKASDVKRDGYYNRSKAYKHSGNYRAALSDMEAYTKLNDSIFNLESDKQIEELKTIYDTEKKEAAIALQKEEIKTLNIKAKNDKLTKTLYGVGMLSFLTISGLLYFGFKQRLKKNKIEREKQEAIYKQEIAFKKKELASQTLHLVQKSTFIQELKENLEKIKQSPELFKVEFRRLVMLLKKEKAEDKDWEIFKSYFSEVHNNFDNTLKSIYADITEKEIRLASFLRMNLSTKEIASMLNVLPESVLKSKYRLKKKLNLAKQDDLNTYLNSL